MAPLRFSANLSWLFPELPSLTARFRAAGSAGFEAAEVAFPYAEPPEALARAAQEAGLRLVLINTPPVAAILQKVGRPNLQLQMVSGRKGMLFRRRVFSKSTVKEQWGHDGSLTTVCSSQDIFHWQIMDGNLTGNIREFLPIVGHVQVAQVPGRGEPDSPGELNFPYLFQLLEDEGYKGFVGCEYRPQGEGSVRRHHRGLEVATFVLGQAGLPTDWPVRSCTPPTSLWDSEHPVSPPLN
ncbi:putative hydroxypyruvate isomerase isoform 6-T7 [Dugong dugon]